MTDKELVHLKLKDDDDTYCGLTMDNNLRNTGAYCGVTCHDCIKKVLDVTEEAYNDAEFE